MSIISPVPKTIQTQRHACTGDYDRACANCQARWPDILQDRLEAARDHWQSLYWRYRSIMPRDLPVSTWFDPPPPPDREALMPLVAAMYSPMHRALMREVLLNLLSDDIADIADAIAH
jgi:hypothetical protein